MRSVSKRLSGGLVLLALVALVVPVAYAGDPQFPQQSHIRPPGGVSSQGRIMPPTGAPLPDDPTTDAPINPPGGDDARTHSPGGAPPEESTFFGLMLEWLRAQVRSQPPVA